MLVFPLSFYLILINLINSNNRNETSYLRGEAAEWVVDGQQHLNGSSVRDNNEKNVLHSQGMRRNILGGVGVSTRFKPIMLLFKHYSQSKKIVKILLLRK